MITWFSLLPTDTEFVTFTQLVPVMPDLRWREKVIGDAGQAISTFELVGATRRSAGVMKVASSPKLIPAPKKN